MERQAAMLRVAAGKFFQLAICGMTLSACGPKFPLDVHQFNAHIKASYPVGSAYSTLKEQLISHGFRAEIDNDEFGIFVFSNAGGVAHCGQIIEGSTNPVGELSFTRNPTEKIARIKGNQGCFRTFVP